MRMGVGALAFAAMDAFGHEAMEYVQDEQARVTKVRLIIFWGNIFDMKITILEFSL